MNTTEQVIELLKPRYKVVADDTSANFEVDEIIYVDDSGHSLLYTDNGRLRIHLDSYPHLFKRLEWWEERNPEEMPEYVSYLKRVWKIQKHFVSNGSAAKNWMLTTGGEHYTYAYTSPATKEEYESFINQNKQQ